MKMNVPFEIKQRISRKRAVRLCVFFGVLILLFLAFVFWSPFAGLKTNNKIISFCISLVVDAYATGVPLKLFGRDWQGEVISVNVKSAVETRDSSLKLNSSVITNNIILTVKSPKDVILVKEIERARVSHSEQALERYKAGDYAARMAEVPYPAHYDSENDQTRCVICGTYNPNSSHGCKVCGSALVTFGE